MTNWPYPRWIAHRGAGKLAPENTLAAFKLGAEYGYRMFECDVKLSGDDVLFLLHDATLDRTTNALGDARAQSWQALSQLDAGAWHSSGFAGEPLASFASVARYCLDNGCFLNIEIKPTPGLEAKTGAAVATTAAQLWRDAAVPPLLTSFQVACLAAAQRVQPQLPRGLLLDELTPDWLETALALGCVAVVCNYKLWNADTVGQARKAGLKTLSYTANDPVVVENLLLLGTDGIITDRLDLFRPDTEPDAKSGTGPGV
ncbi:MAG: glycerophosphodiester phosphodiesterase [Polaromonas sp.]|nr:MAG: glycerophosphodiester phosphodiesterase [Polaromonas sp.]